MASFEKSLKLAWKYFIIITLLAGIMMYGTVTSNPITTAELDRTLLAAKITLTSILLAAMTFYHRTFWETVESHLKKVEELRDVVRYFSPSFSLLFGSTVLVFISTASDLYATFFMDQAVLKSLSLGLFFTGLILLFCFLLFFFGRSLAEMQILKEVAEIPSSPTALATEADRILTELQRQLEERMRRAQVESSEFEQLLRRIKRAKEELTKP